MFAFNLLLIIKGLRQSEWLKAVNIYTHLTDRAEQTGEAIAKAAKSMWLNPLKALWHGILWILGERMEDWWTILDMCAYWIVNVSLALIVWRTECSYTVIFAVITTFLILLKLLGYLRGFENCGWLLSVLYQNFLDSKGFLVVIFTILLGFSIMFQLLLGPYSEDYMTPSRSFSSIFEIGILGIVDRSQFNESRSIVLTTILLVVLILVVLIIALVSLFARIKV